MRRHIAGLHGERNPSDDIVDGAFLVRVDRVFYRWHPERPFYVLRLVIREPEERKDHSFTGRLYCTPKALWKLRWFLRDFGYDQDLMGRDEVDERALLGLSGIVRIFPYHFEPSHLSQSQRVCTGHRMERNLPFKRI